MPRAKLFYVSEFFGLVIICLTASYGLADAQAIRGAAPQPATSSHGAAPTPAAPIRGGQPPAAIPQQKPAVVHTDWPSDESGGQSRIQAALDQPTEMDFVDTPLKDIVDFLKARHKIEIQLDNKALGDAGITPDTTFTRQLKGLPLSSSLHLLLADKDLTYFNIGGDILMITTADEAKSHMVVRVYDVRRFEEPVDKSQIAAAAGCGSAGRASASRATTRSAGIQGAPGATAAAPNKSSGGSGCMPGSDNWLIETITTSVAPTSWDSQGGRGSIAPFNGSLVVAQTQENQEQVSRLFAALDAARKDNSGQPIAIRPSTPQTQKIEAALDQPTEMDFVDTPLKDIVDFLKSRHGIEIQLDNKALGDAGVTPDTTFTHQLKTIPLRVALSLLLADKDLDYVIKDDVLLITTADVAKATTEVVVYPVGDLLGPPGAKWDDLDYDSLIEVITSTVSPESWDTNGGPGSIPLVPNCKALVILQTQRIHRDIRHLLTELRAQKPPTDAAAASSNSTAPKPKTRPASNEPILKIYPMSAVFGGPPAEVEQRDLQRFSEAVRRLIAPDTWTRRDVYLSYVSGSLIVRQTPEVHRKIQELIDQFTAQNQRPQPVSGNMGGFGGGLGGGGFGGTP